jgi:hypothetical protein
VRKFALFCAGVAAMFVLGLPITPAWSQNTISYVSGSGDTSLSNTCGDPKVPCQSLIQAFTNTADQGTVMCVGNAVFDGGGAPISPISKSVTIDCTSFSLFSLGVMTIDAPGKVIRLRNLSFDGTGIPYGNNSNFAINVLHVAELYIENCRINNFSGSAPGVAINFMPGGSGRSRLTVADTVITRNASNGILVQPTGSGLTEVVIERTRVEGNGGGVQVQGDSGTGPVQVQVKDSVIVNNVSGVVVFSGTTAPTTVSLSNTLSTGNDFGVAASGQQAVVILDRTTIQASTTLAVTTSSGAVVFSYGNNSINNNTALGTTPTVIGLH